MAEYIIDKIEYGVDEQGNPNIYHLQDAGADIISTYDSSTQTVIITSSHLVDADELDY